MCIFVDQFGNVRFAYQKYSVDQTTLDPRADGHFPRKVRPNQPIEMVHAADGAPHAVLGNWGMNTGSFDWNARDDRLADSPLWSAMWGVAGCHVAFPVSHGYEMTKRHGDRRWFAVKRAADDEPWWVPGLGRVQKGKHRTEWHGTMVTVDAGPVFEPIHDTPREIVMLRGWDEVQAWLSADVAACRPLLRAASLDDLVAYRVHDDVLKGDFPVEDAPKPWDPASAPPPSPPKKPGPRRAVPATGAKGPPNPRRLDDFA